MSSIFGSPKKPKLPVQQAQPEQIETVTEDATEAGRRKRRHLATAGTQTRISGIRSAVASALKKRLGE
jgi:hypothetical protein